MILAGAPPAQAQATSHIVYVRDFAIWKMRDDGSGQVPLTSPSGGEYDSHPSICPTGREVYFDRYSDGQTDIWKINGDGTGLTPITNTPNESEEDPDCGSNGLYSYVVFTKTDVTGAGDVYRMNLDSSNVVQLTATLGVDERFAEWCGTNRVVFSGSDGHDYEIFLIDIQNGGNVQRLTTNHEGGIGGTFPIQDTFPTCSPNGRYVIFSRGPNPAYDDLIKIDVTTCDPVAGTCTGEENITGGNWAYGHERHANYSPGGSTIVYVHEGETNQDVYKQAPFPLPEGVDPIRVTETTADEEHTNWGELGP